MEATAFFLRNHFKLAHEALDDKFYIEFRFINEGKVESEFCKYNDISNILPKVFAYNERKWHSYFGVNPRPLSKNKLETDITEIICLFADVDVGEKKYFSSKSDALKEIQKFLHEPSCLVDSGNGYHLYWFMSEIVHIKTIEDRLRVKRLLSGLIKSLHADPSGCSLERVLRVPGSINHKNKSTCKIVEYK